ncbi:unnamed protein product [Candida verbasci]|uniref:Peptidase A1 domain-containing protein n=1 Tax=Candida verbasci TaxID=1227364 RepID=A0A9W4TX74_9ASCO|nr:unnamed protein product [Candida verbasci]
MFQVLSFAYFIFVTTCTVIKREPKSFKLDFKIGSSNLKRNYISYDLQNTQTQYLIELTVGANLQKFRVALDTGSSELWIPTPNAICPNNRCKSRDTFDPSTSTSFTNLNLPIKDYYVDNTYAIGTYGLDDVYLSNGVKLSQFQFGSIFNTTEDTVGYLGIDYPIYETQNITDKIAYSLYLNSEYAESSILFNAIDKAKYQGELVLLDVDTDDVSVNTTDILIDGVSIGFQDNLILDSGSTDIFLQPQYVNQIWQVMGVNNKYIDCNQPSNKFLTLKFNDIDINIPFSSLVRQSDKAGICWVGISPTISGSKNYAGDFFLRAVYAAYNLETRKIGIAPALYTDAENIVDFWF